MALCEKIHPLHFDLASLHFLKINTWEVISRKKTSLGHLALFIHHPNSGSFNFCDFSVSQRVSHHTAGQQGLHLKKEAMPCFPQPFIRN